MARRPTRAPRTPQAPPDLGGHGDSAPAGAAVATAGGGKMADDLDELLDEVERRLCRLPGMGTVAGPRHGDGEEEERSAAKESRSAVLRRSRRPHPAPRQAGGRRGGAARPSPALWGGRCRRPARPLGNRKYRGSGSETVAGGHPLTRLYLFLNHQVVCR